MVLGDVKRAPQMAFMLKCPFQNLAHVAEIIARVAERGRSGWNTNEYVRSITSAVLLFETLHYIKCNGARLCHVAYIFFSRHFIKHKQRAW